VVTGTVDAAPTEVEPPGLDGSRSSADLLRYEVAVEAVHHGEAGPTIEVVSERDGASCGIDLPPGRYLVVASRDDEGRLYSGLCSGTRPLEAGEEPAGFGPGRPPEAAPTTDAPRPVGGPGGDVVDDDLGPLATAVRWAAVGAVVVALGAGAVLVARRRRPPAT
jgi:hypothetical protein